jgi:hypothetical protein
VLEWERDMAHQMRARTDALTCFSALFISASTSSTSASTVPLADASGTGGALEADASRDTVAGAVSPSVLPALRDILATLAKEVDAYARTFRSEAGKWEPYTYRFLRTVVAAVGDACRVVGKDAARPFFRLSDPFVARLLQAEERAFDLAKEEGDDDDDDDNDDNDDEEGEEDRFTPAASVARWRIPE